jgi:hypothetical protein
MWGAMQAAAIKSKARQQELRVIMRIRFVVLTG